MDSWCHCHCYHMLLSTPPSPTMDTRCPPPGPDLVLLGSQVSPLQIEGPGANVPCPLTALLPNPLDCCSPRCPQSELQSTGCGLGVGPEVLKATAGWQAAAAVTIVLTCLSFSRALNSFLGETLWPAFCTAQHRAAQVHPVLRVHDKTWVDPGPDRRHQHVHMCVVCVLTPARSLTRAVWCGPSRSARGLCLAESTQGGSSVAALTQFPVLVPSPLPGLGCWLCWLPSRKVALPSLLLSPNPDGGAEVSPSVQQG